jgi:hypothetical protein
MAKLNTNKTVFGNIKNVSTFVVSNYILNSNRYFENILKKYWAIMSN